MFSNNDENLKSLETNNSQINLKAHAYYKKNEGNFKHINLTKSEMQEFFKSSQRKIKVVTSIKLILIHGKIL